MKPPAELMRLAEQMAEDSDRGGPNGRCTLRQRLAGLFPMDVVWKPSGTVRVTGWRFGMSSRCES